MGDNTTLLPDKSPMVPVWSYVCFQVEGAGRGVVVHWLMAYPSATTIHGKISVSWKLMLLTLIYVSSY